MQLKHFSLFLNLYPTEVSCLILARIGFVDICNSIYSGYTIYKELVLVRYSIYRSIAILAAKVRYRYLVVSRYFDILVSNAHCSIPSILSIPSIFRYLRYLTSSSSRRRRCDIVVDDDVVYGTALRSLN